jgi:hypothetical protein
MNHIGHEQYLDEPLLPVVTQETVDSFDAKMKVPGYFEAADRRIRKEQPHLARGLSGMMEFGADTDEERLPMVIAAVYTYSLLREQARVAAKAQSGGQPPRGQILPTVSTETALNCMNTLGSLSHAAEADMIIDTFARMNADQPALTARMEELCENISKGDRGQYNMRCVTAIVYNTLETQVEISRLNAQLTDQPEN